MVDQRLEMRYGFVRHVFGFWLGVLTIWVLSNSGSEMRNASAMGTSASVCSPAQEFRNCVGGLAALLLRRRLRPLLFALLLIHQAEDHGPGVL